MIIHQPRKSTFTHLNKSLDLLRNVVVKPKDNKYKVTAAVSVSQMGLKISREIESILSAGALHFLWSMLLKQGEIDFIILISQYN